MQQSIKRKLTAILSADVAGYSRLMDDDEVSTVRTLQAYQKIISDLTEQHNGRIVDSPGDNVMAEFASVVDAVQCAVEIQQELHNKNAELHDNRKMEFRIGINLGDVIEENNRIYGDGVNIAARVESLADAGGISISGRVYEQVENKLDLEYEFLGEKTVKNIRKPIRVYKIPIKIESEKETEESIIDSIVDMSVPADKPSIAVLPFVNMSGDPEQEYFSDGITEEIITALSKVPDLLVIARNSTFVYKGKAINIKQVGKELGVKYVLEGSVRKSGNRIRLTAQLIDAATGNHLWADSYDRNLQDVFELQDELTTRIIEELNIRISHDLRARYKIKGTDNLKAYLKWLEAQGYHNRLNKNDNNQARKIYMEVIDLDPNWAQGYAGLSAVNMLDYWLGYSNSPELCLQESMKYSQKAISLDNSLPEPHRDLSHFYMIKKAYDEAIVEAQKAIELQPSYYVGYYALTWALIFSGELQMAMETVKRSLRLYPKYYVNLFALGVIYFLLEKYAESIASFKAAIQQLSDFPNVHAYLTACYIMAGMEDEARQQAKEILRIDPNFTVDSFTDTLPYKDQPYADCILNALRSAGLK